MTNFATDVSLALSAPRQAGPLLAIASGKGGVGKTTLAIAIAHAFARRGHRSLLVDADLGMANVDVQLGVSAASDLASVVAGDLSLAEAVSSVGEGSFDLIAGPSGSAALAGLDLENVNRLAAGVTAASMAYNRTLIDLAAGAERSTIRLAAAADDVLIVINDEPTSLTDAYAFVKTLRMRDEGACPFVVVNNAPDAAAAHNAYLGFAKTCESFLGFRPPLAGIVRRDPHVPQAIRAQVMLESRYPASDAASDIAKLVRALEHGVAVK